MSGTLKTQHLNPIQMSYLLLVKMAMRFLLPMPVPTGLNGLPGSETTFLQLISKIKQLVLLQAKTEISLSPATVLPLWSIGLCQSKSPS